MKLKNGDFYEDDEPIETIMAIVNRPPDFVTVGPGPQDLDSAALGEAGGVALPFAAVSARALARLEHRAEAEGRTVADVLADLVERHA